MPAATLASWVTRMMVIAFFLVQPLEQVQDLLAGPGIEVAGGLVGQEQGRVVDQGAGDGHALLLAAGELRGVVVQAVPQPHPVSKRLGPVVASPRQRAACGCKTAA